MCSYKAELTQAAQYTDILYNINVYYLATKLLNMQLQRYSLHHQLCM